ASFGPRGSGCSLLASGRVVEEKLEGPAGCHECDAVALEDAEIGRIAQVVALPGIAVEHDVLDAGIRHGGEQMSAPRLRQHLALLRRVRTRRRVAVVAPRRFRRNVTGDDVLLDVFALALPRVAPPATAGGAAAEPVARLERDAGRLQELRRAAVASRQDGLVDRARL